MEPSSPYKLARDLEAAIASILSDVDLYELDPGPRGLIAGLKRDAADARLDARDYEFADSRHRQQVSARAARTRLDRLRKQLLTASQHGIFSAIDIARLSPYIDTISECLV